MGVLSVKTNSKNWKTESLRKKDDSEKSEKKATAVASIRRSHTATHGGPRRNDANHRGENAENADPDVVGIRVSESRKHGKHDENCHYRIGNEHNLFPDGHSRSSYHRNHEILLK